MQKKVWLLVSGFVDDPTEEYFLRHMTRKTRRVPPLRRKLSRPSTVTEIVLPTTTKAARWKNA